MQDRLPLCPLASFCGLHNNLASQSENQSRAPQGEASGVPLIISSTRSTPLSMLKKCLPPPPMAFSQPSNAVHFTEHEKERDHQNTRLGLYK